ncbi:hypothetical protein BT69DRAFT_1329253 [Atractiella rhizophila]|nr:hypothetical protein BT69DRAFT_1329253 [Atractiella rhizophila]
MAPKRKAASEATSAPPTKKTATRSSKRAASGASGSTSKSGGRGKKKSAPIVEDATMSSDNSVEEVAPKKISQVASAPAGPEAILEKYVDKDAKVEGTIGAEGAEALFTDMEIGVEGLEPMVLAWKTGASELGQFNAASLAKFMSSHGLTTLAKLKTYLLNTCDSFKEERSPTFQPFYNFLFPFFLSPGARSLPIDLALTLWSLLLPDYAEADEEMVKDFLGFVEERMKAGLKGITKDGWGMVLEFSRSMQLVEEDGKKTLSGWSEDGAWPTLIDEYAEHVNKHD